MAKTMAVAERDSLAGLHKAVKRSDDEAQKTRIRAIIALKEGKTKTLVAESFAISRTSVVSWVVLYNGGGTDALRMGKGGRPEGNPKWEAEPFEALGKEVEKGGYWSVPKMQQWLAKEKELDIPQQTVWYRVRQMDYSYKSSRPHPARGSEKAREAFKKGASRRTSSH